MVSQKSAHPPLETIRYVPECKTKMLNRGLVFCRPLGVLKSIRRIDNPTGERPLDRVSRSTKSRVLRLEKEELMTYLLKVK